jgi:hypothetical protein
MDAEHIVGRDFVDRFNRTLCLGSPDTEAVAGEIARCLSSTFALFEKTVLAKFP